MQERRDLLLLMAEGEVTARNAKEGRDTSIISVQSRWGMRHTWLRCIASGQIKEYIDKEVDVGTMVRIQGFLLTNPSGNPSAWIDDGEAKAVFEVKIQSLVVLPSYARN